MNIEKKWNLDIQKKRLFSCLEIYCSYFQYPKKDPITYMQEIWHTYATVTLNHLAFAVIINL